MISLKLQLATTFARKSMIYVRLHGLFFCLADISLDDGTGSADSVHSEAMGDEEVQWQILADLHLCL